MSPLGEVPCADTFSPRRGELLRKLWREPVADAGTVASGPPFPATGAELVVVENAEGRRCCPACQPTAWLVTVAWI